MSAARGYDWYRYQGAPDSGPAAHRNGGPTAVAMAIQFATEQFVPIKDVRDFIGGASCTNVEQLQAALAHWNINNQRLTSMAAIDEAIAERGSIVLARLWMSWITPGQDYVHGFSSPLENKGRYGLSTRGKKS